MAHTAERLSSQLCRQLNPAVHVVCIFPGFWPLCYHAPCCGGRAMGVLRRSPAAAGVPGMVAAMLRHLHSLRKMR